MIRFLFSCFLSIGFVFFTLQVHAELPGYTPKPARDQLKLRDTRDVDDIMDLFESYEMFISVYNQCRDDEECACNEYRHYNAFYNDFYDAIDDHPEWRGEIVTFPIEYNDAEIFRSLDFSSMQKSANMIDAMSCN